MNFRHTLLRTSLFALGVATVLPAFAQEAPPAARAGWHRFDEPDPVLRPALPMSVTIPAGTWVNFRLDQMLSSDKSRPGENWTATLTQPIIVNGRVVAQRGQTVGGSVTEAEKAGRAKGVSRLGLELNEISLADGRQVPVRARLMEFRGDTSWGRDAAAAGTTIASGAAIGAAVNGGVGAGIGAAAGVLASTIGILTTRGKATILYPETTLTFRLEAPFTFVIDNEASLRAFAPVQANDYQPRQAELRQRTVVPAPAPPMVVYPTYYYSPYWYGGPRVNVWFGSGWGGGWGSGWHHHHRGRW